MPSERRNVRAHSIASLAACLTLALIAAGCGLDTTTLMGTILPDSKGTLTPDDGRGDGLDDPIDPPDENVVGSVDDPDMDASDDGNGSDTNETGDATKVDPPPDDRTPVDPSDELLNDSEAPPPPPNPDDTTPVPMDPPPSDVPADDGTTAGGDNASSSDPPVNTYCAAIVDWNSEWIAFENEVLTLVNQNRANGAACGNAGSFIATGPLAMNAALQCAARNHSMDMAVRDYFSHTSPEGNGPGFRLDQAEYSGSTWGENIAWGYPTPAAVVSGWMTSPGHCANIMNPNFTEIGVGYFDGSLWTQTFGRP